MQTLRERIPFKLSSSEDNGDEPAAEESRILDEQEQDAVIADLRRAQRAAAAAQYRVVHACLCGVVVLQIWFLLTPHTLGPTTPMHILFSSKTPRAPLLPLAEPLVLLSLGLVLSLAAHIPPLPPPAPAPTHQGDDNASLLLLPRVLRQAAALAHRFPLPPSLRTPPLPPHLLNRNPNRPLPTLPLSLHWTTALLALPPVAALLAARDAPQIAWWAAPPAAAGLLVLVRKWEREGEREVKEVERMRYEAKGA